MARQCTFCSNQARSREDVYPKWLLQKIGNVGPILHRMVGVPHTELSSPVIKAKVVCEQCNNGWMSDLENETKLIMSPLVADLAVTISEGEQKVLARWTVKTAMMLDAACRRGRELCHAQASRERLRTHKEVPRLTAIWLGRFFRHELFSRGGRGWFTINEIPKAAYACITTFIFGHLVIQSMTIHAGAEYTEENFPRIRASDGPWNATLVQIWPNTGAVNWPPAQFFVSRGSHSIGRLINRWLPMNRWLIQ
jgi:hypothetical protein